MSDDTQKKFDTLMTKFASMEKELATLRSQKAAPPAPTATPAPPGGPPFNMNEYIRDPVGYIARMGANQDQLRHVTQVHFAHALGDAAPPELKVLAQSGHQMSVTSQLASQVQQLSQQLNTFQAASAKQSTRESFRTLVADKSKYPHLAAAFAADPSFFDDDVTGHGGNAAELAEALEARHAKLAAVWKPKAPPAASDENADQTDGQSEQTELTSKGDDPVHTIDPTPPPPPRKQAGLWTNEDHSKLRDELVRKYTPRAATTE